MKNPAYQRFPDGTRVKFTDEAREYMRKRPDITMPLPIPAHGAYALYTVENTDGGLHDVILHETGERYSTYWLEKSAEADPVEKLCLRPLPHRMQPKTVLSAMTVENTATTPLWEILVPTASNAGRPFTTRQHRQWDAHIKNVAGGMTLIQPVRGSWIEPTSGEEFTERMIPVRIMCTREQIINICKETARFYDQHAVLATLVASETVLITNPTASVAPDCSSTG